MENTPEKKEKKRYYLIDALRGADVISMVIFHFCFDYFMVFGHDVSWYAESETHIWQQSICWIFIIISGFVWTLGKKGNLKRGLLLNALGFIITAVTCIAMPQEAVWFGILNFIGVSVLIMIPLSKPASHIPAGIGAAISFIMFLFLKNIQFGYVSFYELIRIEVPRFLYDIKILTPLGFPYPDFVSSDYFPIFPWIFLYLFGWYLYRLFEKSESLKKAASVKLPVLTKIGQYSIWIYMIHQPVCMGVCMLINQSLLNKSLV